VIDQMEKSGLRGRGGAGFPTHQKWATVRARDAEKKYVVCNGDEGDPARSWTAC
jgi:NADH-quinone oxidoreductase subunit F